MSNWYLYWVGYAIVVGTLLLACIVVIAKSLADLYFAMYGRQGRPSDGEPHVCKIYPLRRPDGQR